MCGKGLGTRLQSCPLVGWVGKQLRTFLNNKHLYDTCIQIALFEVNAQDVPYRSQNDVSDTWFNYDKLHKLEPDPSLETHVQYLMKIHFTICS